MNFLKFWAKRLLPYAIIILLIVVCVKLVRSNYVWVGFQGKDYFVDLQVCKSDTARLEGQVVTLREARDRANADILQ